MFTELNSILNTSPESFTRGEFILISDRQSDASFLIHHFLSFYLRSRCKVCFLGLVQSFCHYSAVSQRLGVSLTQAKETGQLVFFEGLKESLSVLIPQENNAGGEVMKFLRDPSVGLRSLFEFVSSSVIGSGSAGKGAAADEWGPPVLMVDDLGVLLSLGVDVGAALDFSHYCRASVCSQMQGNMVMLVRCNGEDEEEDDGDEGSEALLKGLSHQCSLNLHVRGLPTGFCKDIHGQVEVCWKRRQGDGPHTQKNLFQYKVHDKGASFFAPGTSSAVL